MRDQNILVGKIITSIHLASDKQAIKFDTEGGESIVATADGDCCSYSWIENIENPEFAIGEVIEATDIDMPDLGEMEGKEVVAYYGFKIKTSKGECTIDYRNDSNGYYGGNLSWPPDRHYGGVYGQNNSTQEWDQVA